MKKESSSYSTNTYQFVPQIPAEKNEIAIELLKMDKYDEVFKLQVNGKEIIANMIQNKHKNQI